MTEKRPSFSIVYPILVPRSSPPTTQPTQNALDAGAVGEAITIPSIAPPLSSEETSFTQQPCEPSSSELKRHHRKGYVAKQTTAEERKIHRKGIVENQQSCEGRKGHRKCVIENV